MIFFHTKITSFILFVCTEPVSNSLDENDKALANSDEQLNDIQQQKPKVKNQATSPNIPSPEPEESQQQIEV